MSKPTKLAILVRPTTSPGAGINNLFANVNELARFTGRLSGMVDEALGLTPLQLAEVVRTLDKFLGLDE